MQYTPRCYVTYADDPVAPEVSDDLGGQGEGLAQEGQGLGPGDRDDWNIEPVE